MTTLYFILTLLAVVCFVGAAFVREEVNTRLDAVFLISLGLALWVLVDVIRLGRAL